MSRNGWDAVKDRRVVFLDAEGTLWRPRPGRSADEYWEDATVARAEAVFEAEPGAHELLRSLKADGHRIVVLSRHVPAYLASLLDHFGYRELVDDVVAEEYLDAGVKARWAQAYLRENRLPAHASLMVGDSPEHDVKPFLEEGLRALLLDREYNRSSTVPRIASLAELAPIVNDAE